MPLTRRSLVLPASPPSVKLARSWVTRVLAEIGREDLVDSAQLGVTELVTNALIHSRPPLSVRVRGTIDHPRIEVVDSSPVPPQRSPLAAELDDQGPDDLDALDVATFGRGLALVAMSASRWGSDLAPDGRSKSVWFEPGSTLADEPVREGEIFDFHPDLEDPTSEPTERMPVDLLGLPAQLWAAWRRYFYELRRELRLLSISAPEDYPLAVELTTLLERADRERRAALGLQELDSAIADGQESVDLHYLVPTSTPTTMVQVRDLLAKVFEAFSEEHLLAVRPPDTLVELQWWYFTEFERQDAGEAPAAWDGPLRLPEA